jgi:hypothetical protein
MRLILGFVLGLTGAALFLSGLDHQAVTRELRAWFETGAEGAQVEEAGSSPAGDAILKIPSTSAAKPAPPMDEARGTEAPRAGPAPAETVAAAAPGPDPEPSVPDHYAAPSDLAGAVAPPAWQPIWRPFKAPSAAQGFAAHLAGLTGDSYRVRRVGDRAYQVELAYHSEAERRALVERVRALTGLELEGGSP